MLFIFQAWVDRERAEKAAVEAKLQEKTRELNDLQNKLDGHQREFNNKFVSKFAF